MDSLEHAKLVKKYPTEQVFVVPFAETSKIPDNLTPGNSIKHIQLKDWTSKGKFVFRHDAEYNSVLQQLIPYVLIVNAAHTKIYVTKRIAGEERLKGDLALGCGGHISPEDAGESVILNAAHREMNEELKVRLKKDTDLEFFGYVRDINSKTNDHLGFVFLATAISASVKETESLEGKWMDYGTLISNYEKFESWAKYIIDCIFLSGGIDALFSKEKEENND